MTSVPWTYFPGIERGAVPSPLPSVHRLAPTHWSELSLVSPLDRGIYSTKGGWVRDRLAGKAVREIKGSVPRIH